MSLEITGRLIVIEPTTQVNDKFRKREFVLELQEEINGNNYTNYGKFQCVQAKCDILDRYAVGEDVTVSFNVKGNRWERDGKVNYITNLDAWRIASAATNIPSDYSNVAKDNTGVVTNAVTPKAPVPNGQQGASGGQEVDPLPF